MSTGAQGCTDVRTVPWCAQLAIFLHVYRHSGSCLMGQVHLPPPRVLWLCPPPALPPRLGPDPQTPTYPSLPGYMCASSRLDCDLPGQGQAQGIPGSPEPTPTLHGFDISHYLTLKIEDKEGRGGRGRDLGATMFSTHSRSLSARTRGESA